MIRAAVAALLLGAAGCTVGPDYRAPTFAGASAAGPFVEAPPNDPAVALVPAVAGPWWQLYRDPALDALVADALAANTDLRATVANLGIARGVLREARALRLPTTEFGGQYAYGRRSVFGSPGSGFVSGGEGVSFFDLGFSVSYEVDLFGRVARTIEAARGNLESQRALIDAGRVAVAADTVRAYADACSYAEQKRVAERTIGLLQQNLDITRRTFEAGRGTRLDVERARTVLEQQRASVPVLEAQRSAALYALAYLSGRTPAELPEAALACAVTPRLERPIPVGDGAGLLARRPDVRAAERRLAADTAGIGIATADLYPRVGLGGAIGTQALSFDGLFSGDALNYSVGPFLSFSFPNRQAVRGRIEQAEGAAAASLADFDGTVLNALRETETAISALARELQRRQSLAVARTAAAKAAELGRLRYKAGIDSFLNVLDAERTLAQAEAELAQSDQFIADNQVNLFRALGGGWEGLPEPGEARAVQPPAAPAR